MDTLQALTDDLQQMRTAVADGETWYVGKDLCRYLEVKSHNNVLGRLDIEERREDLTIRDSLNREKRPVMVSLAGFFSLVFDLQTPTARRIQRWITRELLPSARRSGRFKAPSTTPELDSLMRQLGWQVE